MKLTVLFLILAFTGCTNAKKKKKENHISTWEIENKYYIEQFYTYQGSVFAGDVRSFWLTDSLSLNDFLFSIQDKESLNYKFSGNRLIFQKTSRRSDNKGEVLDELVYSFGADGTISKLKETE